MLSVYSGEDNGPADISEEFFEENSCRCGRILESDTRVNFNMFVSIECVF